MKNLFITCENHLTPNTIKEIISSNAFREKVMFSFDALANENNISSYTLEIHITQPKEMPNYGNVSDFTIHSQTPIYASACLTKEHVKEYIGSDTFKCLVLDAFNNSPKGKSFTAQIPIGLM